VVYDFEDVAYQDSREQPEDGEKPVHEQMKLKLQPSEPDLDPTETTGTG
jgi:S-DNA-T family DNA segregation ATPase FtsK/SpoIIIE